MSSKYELIWQLTHGERLRYGAAIVALVLASCFLYLVPFVSSMALDVVIQDNRPQGSRFLSWALELMGGREVLRAKLWIAVVLILSLTILSVIFTNRRGLWSAIARE